MSRTRLIASMSSMFAIVAVVVVLGAFAFPLNGVVSLVRPRNRTLTSQELTIRPATAWEVKTNVSSNVKLAPGRQDPSPQGKVTASGATTPVIIGTDGKAGLKPLPETINRQLVELGKTLMKDSGTQDIAPPLQKGDREPPLKNYHPGKTGIVAAICLSCPSPGYTPEGRRAHTSGIVYLEVEVLENGRAGEIKLVKGIGNGLDEKAIETIKNAWIFEPASGPEGKPVATIVPVECTFELWGQDAETPKLDNDQDVKIFTAPVTDFDESTPFYLGKVKTEVISASHPAFPQIARRMNLHEGHVDLDIILDTEGNVIAARLIRASNPFFIQAAMDQIRIWKIKGTHDGKPVTFQALVELQFQLF